MTLSISLPPASESRLERLASAAGKDATTYATELLQEAVNRVEFDALDRANDEEGPTIGRRLAGVLNEVWSIKPEPPRPATDTHEAAVRHTIAEKFRKQGLKL